MTRLIKSLLYAVTPLDPMTFAAMPVLLAAALARASCRGDDGRSHRDDAE